MTQPPDENDDVLIQARREKLRRWREEFAVEPYGHRVDGLIALAEARARFDAQAHEEYTGGPSLRDGTPDAERRATTGTPDAERRATTVIHDRRQRARVAGRCVQHRAMGSLVFIVLRDHSGDLQVSVSKAAVDANAFKIAGKLDYGDIVVAEGPVGKTRNGEICVWADRFEVHCKSLVPPPEKFHGLADAELRYRQRYVDMYANPQTLQVMQTRSRLVSQVRRFMDGRGYLEVETPMMQPIAGGAAARPFVTHHNALDIDLFLRIAPELYLKRLLVGGLPRVYEINRNFRNEGVDRQHNPEFTMMEVYEAFGDCETMLELTESLLNELAGAVGSPSLRDGSPDAERRAIEEGGPFPRDGTPDAERRATTEHGAILPFGDLQISYARPFARVSYGELFERQLGFPMTDVALTIEKAKAIGVEDAGKLDHWLLVSELFERFGEAAIEPSRPTFVTDFPSAISPLTRPHPDRPELSYRWELFIAGMEIANSYTELNDPDVQLARFTEQLKGADDEATTFRALDMDFIHALRVGMPPAGGLGIGIDRVIMLMTNSTTIRDVILFPLMRPE